jgi:hypothetical protein
MKTTVLSQQSPKIDYPIKTLRRAELALKDSPFCLVLFVAMGLGSVPLPLMANQSGLMKGYTEKFLSERRVEVELTWLIQVGLLRREVDGQGITDSFRLTPLGKYLVEQWKSQGPLWKKITLGQRLINRCRRWFPWFL